MNIDAPSNFAVAAIRACCRAEVDAFAEISEALYVCKVAEWRGSSRRAGTRDSHMVFVKLWFWAIRRWPGFPNWSYDHKEAEAAAARAALGEGA